MLQIPNVDAVLFDLEDTLVEPVPPGSTTGAQLVPRAGVVDSLIALAANHRLGAVSDDSTLNGAEMQELLAHAGVSLDVVMTSLDQPAQEESSQRFVNLSYRLGVAPHRSLLIGRRPVDSDAARETGISFVPVDFGIADAIERAALRTPGACAEAARRVAGLDPALAKLAQARHSKLSKPVGSLGRLEELGSQLAAITNRCPAPVPRRPVVAIFAGDHGVANSGVTPWPQDITAAMVSNFVDGGAAINTIARQVGADVRIIDVGVSADLQHINGIEHRKVRPGTRDLMIERAMTTREVRAALDVGADVATRLVAAGYDLLIAGDMGIGNTTSAAALIAALTKTPAHKVTGRGTGIDDAMLAHKTDVVAQAVARTEPYLDPVSIVAEVGGLEIAALAGYIIGGAAHEVPIVIDGVIALAALLIADTLVPLVTGRCIAGHRSSEPGATVALGHLGIAPLLDLDLRLGEGTGACLAVPLIQVAARLLHEMATLGQLDR